MPLQSDNSSTWEATIAEVKYDLRQFPLPEEEMGICEAQDEQFLGDVFPLTCDAKYDEDCGDVSVQEEEVSSVYLC